MRDTMNEPRAFTAEEIRNEVLDHLRTMSRYWSKLPNKTPRELCDGMAFSFLSMLDGCSIGIPAYNLVTSPHPDDEQYCKDNGENWYPTGLVINDCMLHELYYAFSTPTAQPDSDQTTGRES